MTRHLELGRRAEEFAAAWVKKLGWQILSRNFTCRLGELDIVALERKTPEKRENELVVVEVRYRTTGEIQSPSDSIGPKKLRTLVNAGRVYVENIGWTGPWRIDLIGVTASPHDPEDRWRLEHITDITGGNFPV
ncbi:MAG: YraN family protein [Synergistaceae bacterium]|jgi:putative endonuclease|nr:YraN family protein [Synergistaceae bacterium]